MLGSLNHAYPCSTSHSTTLLAMGLIYTDCFKTSPCSSPSTSDSFSISSEEDANYVLTCQNCHTHICLHNLIISENFQGQKGDAFFVSQVLNVDCEKKEKKVMLTGNYVICEIRCKQCHNYLGWKYLKCDSKTESYKVGNYVIEAQLLNERYC